MFGVEAKKMKPTRKHRMALWENMLGTVMARNQKGKTKYFDYNYKAARDFAGVKEASDFRVWKYRGFGIDDLGKYPSSGQKVLYIIHTN